MLLLLSFLMLATLVVCLGATFHDIRSIRLQRDKTRHPHARRWRHRPLIHITSPQQIDIAGMKRQYRNIVASTPNSPSKDNYTLLMKMTQTLPSAEILHAVQQLQAQSYLSSIVLIPTLPSPSSLLQLLTHFRLIYATPLASARSGLGINTYSPLPTLVRPAHTITLYLQIWRILYELTAYMCKLASLLVIGYAVLTAHMLAQPLLALVVLCCFLSYSTYAIWQYRLLSRRQKIIYIALSPVSIGYLLIISIWATCVTHPVRLVTTIVPQIRRSYAAVATRYID